MKKEDCYYTLPYQSYTKSFGWECNCLGVMTDGFRSKDEAYEWIIEKLTGLLGEYVDHLPPDELPRKD